MSDSQRRVPTLVAGVSGTLGRTIARHLKGKGWEVSGICRGPGEFREPEALAAALPAVDVHYGDLADLLVAQKACAGVDSVVFAAGSSGVAASFDDPVANLVGNAVPWINLLRSCRLGTHLVLLSSQLVYGPAGTTPFHEDDEARPASPYALHRRLLEEYGRLFALRLGLEVTVLRLGNVFGDIIDLAQPRTHGVVAHLVKDLVNPGTARLYGDGTQCLNLLHAEDLARAVTAVLQTSPEAGKFSVFNISGHPMAVRQVAEAIRNGLGSGTTICVPWDPTLRQSLARNVQLDDSAFRSRYDWCPARDVEGDLTALGRAWRQ